ncbi:Myb-like DNA-binding domain containing protein [Tritrichomonas foetus]|uniref:Myb-like DNA-binding domain containing protein n=1 Tax=Tritrichomonas foetus TaxID=1144522 RepID=A0A1J4L6I7_9EUKA|nr:Myb-like DNA-binding domain containing protein [Tritrichomonas foetus]|eukprot:OHT17557.1 Myb-like DNA-binding domain containing protein [Tritrichomonas foetus]
MFEVNIISQELDPFNLSRRPLHIQNCNIKPQFQPANTRISLPQVIYESRKEYFESVNGFWIRPPINNDQPISPEDPEELYSDHFNRDFAPFTMPEPNGNLLPFVDPKTETQKLPQWMLDLPSTAMKTEPKIYYEEATNPQLFKGLPNCDSCQKELSYPFFASFKYNICKKCYHKGKLPPSTNSLEFFVVENPSKISGSWSIKETNKLLSIIEDIGDNWEEIARQMKTRSPSECLIHFLRLPMYDQYYIADPCLVPPGEIPSNEPHILPFMVAPDPIASYVEFLHILNKKLGNIIADISQKKIEQILSSKSGMMLFNKVPDIMKELLQCTAEEAGKIARDEFEVLMEAFRRLNRLISREADSQYYLFDNQLKESQSLASRITIANQDSD